MSGAELRIPIGLTGDGLPEYPNQAVRGVQYTCPECGTPLVLRSGPLKRPHFAHHRTPTECDFLNEGWLHIAAKWAVWGAVEQWIQHGKHDSGPTIVRACQGHYCRNKHAQPIPDRVMESKMEFPLMTSAVSSPMSYYWGQTIICFARSKFATHTP